jgi:hypothetical protein
VYKSHEKVFIEWQNKSKKNKQSEGGMQSSIRRRILIGSWLNWKNRKDAERGRSDEWFPHTCL